MLCKIDSFWHNKCSLSNVLNLKLSLKFYQMHFWFEFFDIHMNEQTTCYNYHGVKWQNINIFLILINFVYSSTPFIVSWIVMAPFSPSL